jgi:hypothetical protein
MLLPKFDIHTAHHRALIVHEPSGPARPEDNIGTIPPMVRLAIGSHAATDVAALLLMAHDILAFVSGELRGWGRRR